MIIEGELHTVTRDLSLTHLGCAIDLLRSARAALKDSTNPQRSTVAHRASISSIVHAYAALESHINHFGFELFTHERSPLYIAVEKRSFLLKRFIQSWNSVQFVDKLLYLVTDFGALSFPEKLRQEVRELNTLRNWLVHGFSYSTTLLLQPSGDDTYDVVDTEDSVDWRQKFPQTKFRAVDELSTDDAAVALRICLEALRLVSEAFNQPIAVVTLSPAVHYQILFRESFDITAILAAD